MSRTVSCAAMAVLTRDAILRELESGRLRIEPLAPDQVGPASIDLTLGNEIRVLTPGADAIPIRDEVDFLDHTESQTLDEPYVLPPGGTIHGITVEKITLPPDLCGFLEGRSRFARLGLMIHVTSAFVQPGVSNRQVLEMSNVAGHPLQIHAGVRLCQIVLMRTEGQAVYRGRFAIRSARSCERSRSACGARGSRVDGEVVGEMGAGLLALVGVGRDDDGRERGRARAQARPPARLRGRGGQDERVAARRGRHARRGVAVHALRRRAQGTPAVVHRGRAARAGRAARRGGLSRGARAGRRGRHRSLPGRDGRRAAERRPRHDPARHRAPASEDGHAPAIASRRGPGLRSGGRRHTPLRGKAALASASGPPEERNHVDSQFIVRGRGRAGGRRRCAAAPANAQSETKAEDAGREGEAGLGVAAGLVSVVYAPAKVLYAAGGGLVAGLAYVFSAGDKQVTEPILTPALRGDYVVTPAHLRGERQLEFIGREPEDRALRDGVEPARIQSRATGSTRRRPCRAMRPSRRGDAVAVAAAVDRGRSWTHRVRC